MRDPFSTEAQQGQEIGQRERRVHSGGALRRSRQRERNKDQNPGAHVHPLREPQRHGYTIR